MLLAISISAIVLGIFLEVALSRKARRDPDFGDAPEGLQFVGYTMVALGAVACTACFRGKSYCRFVRNAVKCYKKGWAEIVHPFYCAILHFV